MRPSLVPPPADEEARPSRIRRRLALVTSALFLSIPVGWFSVVRIISERRLAAARASWDMRGVPLDRPEAVFPAEEPGEREREADRLAAPLGFQLTHNGTPTAGGDWDSLHERIREEAADRARGFVGGGVSRESAVARLRASREAVDRLASFLVAGAPLITRFDPAVSQPIPARGYLRASRTLVLHALLVADRDPPAADRALEAGWSLRLAALRRPDLVSRMVALRIGGIVAGGVRALDSSAPRWQERFDAPEPIGLDIPFGLEAARLASAFRQEGAGVLLAVDVGHTAVRSALGGLFAPIAPGILAANLEWLRRHAALPEPALPCDPARLFPLLDGKDLPPMARIAIPLPTSAEERIRVWRLETELTSLVLEARRLRDAAAGRWPEELPSTRADRCLADRWTWQSGGGAAPTLALTVPIRSGRFPYQPTLDWKPVAEPAGAAATPLRPTPR